MEQATKRSTRMRAVSEASLALHAPALGASDIVALLERLVVDLQLGHDVLFVPSALDDRQGGAGGGAQVEVQIRRSNGAVEGALRCVPHDEEAREAILMLAAHTGVALGSVARLARVKHREQAVRRVAEQLQDALLPDLPDLPYNSLAVRYQAAARDARVGGDFYDVFPLPDRRVLLVFGDVVGKGVEAASRTSRIVQTCRALALQDLDLGTLLERVDEQVCFQDPDMMATLWCGLYEPASGELAFASLGHPPALLLRSDGEPIHLTLEGLPLGARDLAPEPPEIRTRLLMPRDLLILYTDGVVEGSGDFLAGQRALLAAVERRRDETLVRLVEDALDELLADAGHTDDALMLALRRR